MLQGHTMLINYIVQLHWIRRHQLLAVGIYQGSKNCRKYRIRRLSVEFIQHGLCEHQEMARACRARSATYTCQMIHGQLFPVGCKLQLNTAYKRVKLDQPATSRITWPMFNVESPNFTRTSMPTYSTPHWI